MVAASLGVSPPASTVNTRGEVVVNTSMLTQPHTTTTHAVGRVHSAACHRSPGHRQLPRRPSPPQRMPRPPQVWPFQTRRGPVHDPRQPTHAAHTPTSELPGPTRHLDWRRAAYLQLAATLLDCFRLFAKLLTPVVILLFQLAHTPGTA